MPNTSENSVELDVFAGGIRDPELDEPVSGDRGDSIEPVADQQTPVDEPQQASQPTDEPQAAAETPAEPVEAVEPEPAEPRIPKSRFDQVNERRKAAEQRAKELEAQLEVQRRVAQPPVDFDFDAAEQKYMEAVVDGEFDKAKAIRTEIRNAERQVLAVESARTRELASEATLARIEFDKTVSELQAAYPVYDPEAESFDEGLTNEALEIHSALLATNKYTPAQALRKAAEIVAKANGMGTAAAPAVPKEPARNTKPDVPKKTAAAAAQPPVPSVGSRGDSAPSVHNMSEEEFASLPESTLRKLRGDLF